MYLSCEPAILLVCHLQLHFIPHKHPFVLSCGIDLVASDMNLLILSGLLIVRVIGSPVINFPDQLRLILLTSTTMRTYEESLMG